MFLKESKYNLERPYEKEKSLEFFSVFNTHGYIDKMEI